MNTDSAMIIVNEHHQTLRRQASDSRRRPVRRLLPRLLGWRVSWSQTILIQNGLCVTSCTTHNPGQ
jgi:hypothetical protein